MQVPTVKTTSFSKDITMTFLYFICNLALFENSCEGSELVFVVGFHLQIVIYRIFPTVSQANLARETPLAIRQPTLL